MAARCLYPCSDCFEPITDMEQSGLCNDCRLLACEGCLRFCDECLVHVCNVCSEAHPCFQEGLDEEEDDDRDEQDDENEDDNDSADRKSVV